MAATMKANCYLPPVEPACLMNANWPLTEVQRGEKNKNKHNEKEMKVLGVFK